MVKFLTLCLTSANLVCVFFFFFNFSWLGKKMMFYCMFFTSLILCRFVLEVHTVYTQSDFKNICRIIVCSFKAVRQEGKKKNVFQKYFKKVHFGVTVSLHY